MKRSLIAVIVNLICLTCGDFAAAFTLEPCWSTYTADTSPIYNDFKAEGGIADFATISDGAIKLNSIGKDTYGWYKLDSQQELDFDKGITLKFRARLLSSEGGGTAAIIIYDRNSRFALVELLPNKINITNVAYATVNTSEYHSYYVSVKSGTNNTKVYLDSSATPILTGTLPATVLTDCNTISFGDFTSTADADWEISNISWTPLGAFTPGFFGFAGDYNFDCRVNITDYAILASHWLSTYPEINLSGAAVIDYLDLSVLTSNYLKQLENSNIYISDLSQAQPAASLSQTNSASKWVVMPYETAQFEGKMLGSFSFNNLADITIPLPVTGWHAVYIGYWNPDFAWDGTFAIKFKLTGDTEFSEIHETATQDTQDATYLREVFAANADLTGQDLVIGKLNNLAAKKTFIAYIKLVPLSQQQVSGILSDRSQSATRNAVAAIDTKNLFQTTQISSPNDLKRIVEPYKYSDIRTVLLTVGYGDQVTYNSDVSGAVWIADTTRSTGLSSAVTGTDIAAGQKQMALTLRTLVTQNTPLEQTVAGASHTMGLKFDILFNMALPGGFPAWPGYDPNSFVNKNQTYWQVRADGTKVRKASYAFTQVQDFFKSVMEEAVLRTGADGVCLSFDTGPHFIGQQDSAFVTAFRAKYGINPRTLAATDVRLGVVRSEFMTSFMTQLRVKLDQLETQTGKQLTLSVWVWPSTESHANGLTPKQEGIDVNAWLAAGLIDSVYCKTPDANYVAWCQSYSRTFALVLSPDVEALSPPAIVAQSYGAGVNNFVFSSVQQSQIFPQNWSWMSRIGHMSEILNWNSQAFSIKNVRLNNVNGVDVRQGLAAAVYSGG